MNRRNFIKSIGLTTAAMLLPNNIHSDNEYIEDVPAEDIKFSTDILTLKEIENDKTKYNGELIETKYLDKNITTNYKYFGKNTTKSIKLFYDFPWISTQTIKGVSCINWSILNKKYLHYKPIDFTYHWEFFGYNGPSNKIIVPCKLENKYNLNIINLKVCGLSKGLQKIEIEDFPENEKDVYYPSIYNDFLELLFNLTFEELNQLSINRIILPKKMFEENKKYFPIIEKNTKIKFEIN